MLAERISFTKKGIRKLRRDYFSVEREFLKVGYVYMETGMLWGFAHSYGPFS